eukprot:TRINITY_DN14802_c0_g1_i2.p1 TRINITY_DN14802_c0_g1~~TRINITY_DN14802_c0_g1_i2.p1  ORF type:complete len:200 (+),score=10.12 TRINITY_DN14802_c0_g1_i2:50-601(+)
MQEAGNSTSRISRLCSVIITLLLLSNSQAEEKLIGWEGETFNRRAVFGDEDVMKQQLKQDQEKLEQPWIETVSWTPRSFVYHNFLSEEECAHIIRLATTQLKRSTVVGDKDGGNVDAIRTSYGMFIPRYYDPVITTVEEKLANWTHLPISYQEDIQVLRYQYGQKYGAHYDALGRICYVFGER